MRIREWTWMTALAALVFLFGCEGSQGTELEGEIILSSQLQGTETYYLYGYSFEDSEMYKYNYLAQTDPLPDIINEGFPVIDGSEQWSMPGFNTPGRVNGFALVGEFSSLDEAEDFYNDYSRVEEGLQYSIVSDTVRLHQVWVQQTSEGNYAKMLVKEISHGEGGGGIPYTDVLLKYHYSNDGSAAF